MLLEIMRGYDSIIGLAYHGNFRAIIEMAYRNETKYNNNKGSKC